ncbi:hypothetical protein CN378_01065 [Bacillus sp. AFS015802]|uniref:hypothetical protein n=1 Tax=Bacillus sp. AFS015802 TaxID=2033486 RepID=UPI000BF9AFDC|nr:hypothetical protein [Bacillus sp. AFS015802]PFA70410.1 hypothetical protein CN378_01065 [Bacillus sp. AFS015802]
MRRLLRKNGRAETPEAKLRRLGRSSAESEVVPLPIEQILVDRAKADPLFYKENPSKNNQN